MKDFLKAVGFFGMIFGAMYLAKFFEIIFSKIPDNISIPLLIILFVILIYEILKRL